MTHPKSLADIAEMFGITLTEDLESISIHAGRHGPTTLNIVRRTSGGPGGTSGHVNESYQLG